MGSGEHPLLPNSLPVPWGLADTACADLGKCYPEQERAGVEAGTCLAPFSDSGTTQHSCQSDIKHHGHQFLLFLY